MNPSVRPFGSVSPMEGDETLSERQARDERMMAEVRAGGGTTGSGQVLVILAITGARSGRRLLKPMCVREDGRDLVVAASAGGQPAHPQWYHNLVANPEVTVEYLGESFQATAAVVPNSTDRDRLFQSLSEEIIGLYSYQDRCRDTRQIPIIRLRRI
jgi:deazaflavin-dependent oxidoreductase (nitroreductase family)